MQKTIGFAKSTNSIQYEQIQLNTPYDIDEHFENFERYFMRFKRKITKSEQLKKSMCKRQLELEQALRDSVAIVAEGERDLNVLEKEKHEMEEKIHKLQQRILSLKNANFLRCSSCQELKSNQQVIKEKTQVLLSYKQEKLQQLMETKQELLESLLSEMDTQIAMFEVTGARSQEQIERLDRLRSDRSKLNRRLKIESENAINFITETKNQESELYQHFETQVTTAVSQNTKHSNVFL